MVLKKSRTLEAIISGMTRDNDIIIHAFTVLPPILVHAKNQRRRDKFNYGFPVYDRKDDGFLLSVLFLERGRGKMISVSIFCSIANGAPVEVCSLSSISWL